MNMPEVSARGFMIGGIAGVVLGLLGVTWWLILLACAIGGFIDGWTHK